MIKQATVRVPASVSNLGPGFDCLGVAVSLYNIVRVERAATREGLPKVFDDAARRFFKQSRVRPFAFTCSVRENLPRSRGPSNVPPVMKTTRPLSESMRELYPRRSAITASELRLGELPAQTHGQFHADLFTEHRQRIARHVRSELLHDQ